MELTTPILVKEGWALDENIRKKSSSGGIASELARSFVRTGGIVCSCSNQNGNFEFSLLKMRKKLINLLVRNILKVILKEYIKKYLRNLKMEKKYFLLVYHVK